MMSQETEQNQEQEPLQPAPEKVEDAEEKKLKRREQLRDAREAKKLKQQEKSREEAEVRAALLQLKQENEQLRKRNTKPKRKREEPEEVKEDEEVSFQPVAKKKRGPVRVTRQPEGEYELDNGPSMTNQIAKVGIVSLLGLGSWYVQNKMFNEKKKNKPQKKEEKEKTSTSPPTKKPKSMLASYRNIGHKSSKALQGPTKPKLVGKSGLAM